MALLRSEVQVAIQECRENFLTSQVVEQIKDSFQEQRLIQIDSRGFHLPLDSAAFDYELECNDNHRTRTHELTGASFRQYRSPVEVSPTDSAFHSDDVSPESSRYDGLLSSCSDVTISVNGADCRKSDGSGQFFPDASDHVSDRISIDGMPSRECHLLRTARSCFDVDYAALQAQPWWDSNWSLHSDGSCCSTVLPTCEENYAPLALTKDEIPFRCDEAIDADDSSVRSEVCSVKSLESISPGNALEELAFLTELVDVRIGIGQVARFHCELLSSRAVTVTWYHGCKIVENCGRYRTYRNGRKHMMEIYFTTFPDFGEVRCRAMGLDCLVETRARLRIRESRLPLKPPEFVYKLSSVEISKGDDVELCCKVKGQPVPVLTWFLNGRKISSMDSGISAEHIGKEEWLLLIDGTRLLCSSTVRCLASSPLGESVCSASVLVVSVDHRELTNLDGRLAHLDRKLSHATAKVLDSAQQMLSDANQMASLDRQLKAVDTYLSGIESKLPFSESDITDDTYSRHRGHVPLPPLPPDPPQLSLVQVSFPSRGKELAPSPSPRAPPLVDPSPPPTVHKPQSVSITVLSKHVESDKVRVVFKQSFGSPTVQHEASLPECAGLHAQPSQLPSYSQVVVDPWLIKPNTSHCPKDEPVVSLDTAGRVSPILSSPKLTEHKITDIKQQLKTIGTTGLNQLISFPVITPVVLADNQHATEAQHVRSEFTDLSRLHDSPEVLLRAHDTVKHTSERLRNLDNRVDIIQADLLTSDYGPEDLKHLESAVSLTASEIQATDRTIKQVESLVTCLQQTRHHQSTRRQQHQHPPDLRQSEVCSSCLPCKDTVVSSPLVTYFNMSASPQDFPQDGVPSVKSLMSRFQTGGPENNSLRRIGSTASEDGSSDVSVTSSPDSLDRKPLPVFNKTKFHENVLAARNGQKPRIQASITARSLSREMREQLSISRPQMGAFRSNIMTSENGEYDPKRALRAKELFIAESAHEHDSQDTHKNGVVNGSLDSPTSKGTTPNGVGNGVTNGSVNGNGYHHHETFDEEAEEEAKTPSKSPKLGALSTKHSKTVDYDSLDEEEDVEPQYAKIVKKDSPNGDKLDTTVFKARSASASSNHSHREEPELITPRNSTPVAAVHDNDKDSLHSRKASNGSIHADDINGKDIQSIRSRKSSSGSSVRDDKPANNSLDSGAHSPEVGQSSWSPPQLEEDDSIPLSQVPNWDLLI